jgi:hypothetical protein
MNALLFANHITSGGVVLLCWWLAHQYSRDEPPGRMISVGFSIVGFSVLVTALARTIDTGTAAQVVAWTAVTSKAGLLFTFSAISVRRHRLRLE